MTFRPRLLAYPSGPGWLDAVANAPEGVTNLHVAIAVVSPTIFGRPALRSAKTAESPK
nr:MAG TPA: hypothetical protein [Caudoviricetes sp.]